MKLYERRVILILILIISISFLLRVYQLDSESLTKDEAFSIDIAKNNLSIFVEKMTGDVHPPFYYIILHFWMKLFGYSEFATRFLSVIFGILSVYTIFKLGELIFDNRIGLMSSFILSISLFHIRYSQDARFYTLLPLLILLSNYYFVKMVQEKRTKYTNIYIIFTVMMIYTHIFGLFYVIFQNIYYFLVFKKDIKSWIMTQGMILLLFIPWVAILMVQVVKSVENNWWIYRPTFLNIIDTFKSFAGGDINFYLFIILGIMAIREFQNKEYPHKINIRYFLLLWLFIPILISFGISLILKPIYVSRYVIGSLPAFVLLISKGIFDFKKRSVILILIAILSISTIHSLSVYYHTPENFQWRDVVKYIEDNKKDSDVVVIYTPTPGVMLPFKYYYKSDSNFAGIYAQYQINNFTRYDGIWLVIPYYWSPLPEESKKIKNMLTKTYVKIRTIKFVGIELNYYQNKFGKYK